MKKTILILLALVLTLSMAACGNQANNHLPVSTPSVQQTEAVVQTAPVETTVPVTEPEITFEELTVIDDENCFVKITGITPPSPTIPTAIFSTQPSKIGLPINRSFFTQVLQHLTALRVHRKRVSGLKRPKILPPAKTLT